MAKVQVTDSVLRHNRTTMFSEIEDENLLFFIRRGTPMARMRVSNQTNIEWNVFLSKKDVWYFIEHLIDPAVPNSGVGGTAFRSDHRFREFWIPKNNDWPRIAVPKPLVDVYDNRRRNQFDITVWPKKLVCAGLNDLIKTIQQEYSMDSLTIEREANDLYLKYILVQQP